MPKPVILLSIPALREKDVAVMPKLRSLMAGILTLDQPLDLPDQSRVRVAVEPLEGWQPQFSAGLDAWKAFSRNTPSMPAGDDTRGTNCMNAADTNVFVYFVDRDEPFRRAGRLLGHVLLQVQSSELPER